MPETVINRGSIREFFGSDPNLKGCWSLDGHTQDHSGNGYHGTVSGAIPYTGKFGLGYWFDGSDDEISTGDIDITGAITIMTWVNFYALDKVAQEFVTKPNTGNNGNYIFQYFDQSVVDPWKDKLRFTFYGAAANNYYTSNNAVGIKVNQWYFLAMRHIFGDATSTKLLCNGIESPGAWVGNGAAATTTNDNAVVLGKDKINYPAIYILAGTMCETAIISRALSSVEIAQYYQWATKGSRRR